MTLAHLDLSRGYRTCGVLVRQMSGYPTYQAVVASVKISAQLWSCYLFS